MRILMVSSEYPPMLGGIGRYTARLTKELQKLGLDMYVVCDEKGDGDFDGVSPDNVYSSDTLFKIVNEIKPDIVHVQFDPGLYGIVLDSINPRRACTYIDEFYVKCKRPIVTTFHSGYITARQWIKVRSLIKKTGKIGTLGTPLRALLRLWKYSLNYQAINRNIIEEKVRLSRTCIVLSQYLAKKLSSTKCHVIYHGSEPTVVALRDYSIKQKAREKFLLPTDNDQKIALALGFRTEGKGWDILRKMDLASKWTIAINSSKSYYNKEDLDPKWPLHKNTRNSIVDLHCGYLSDEDLSTLFYGVDAVILPYRATSGSGVMFDALAHGLPFIATDLEFFREFSNQGLGITVKRKPREFSKGLDTLSRNYIKYAKAVDVFKQRLKWNSVAKGHYQLYRSITSDSK